MTLMGRTELFPDHLPNLMFTFGVRRVWNLLTWLVLKCEPRDLVAPFAVFSIIEAWMIGV
jgi:hypothetical protein